MAQLDLRPNCECCDTDLPDNANARICTFECTFCATCANGLDNTCPNCQGNLVERPHRPASSLDTFPASIIRVHNDHAWRTQMKTPVASTVTAAARRLEAAGPFAVTLFGRTQSILRRR